MNKSYLFQKAHSEILAAPNILMVGHRRPDADSLGSLCAFSKYLEGLGKNFLIFNVDLPASYYSFLPPVENLSTNFNDILNFNYDLVVFLDVGDFDHSGLESYLSRLDKLPKIINIDHHSTNANFGLINIVDFEAASTTEIIYRYFKHLQIKITKEIAICLLAGILDDTNNFSNPNTTDYSLYAAGQLLSAGASLRIGNFINKNKSLEVLKLWGKVLGRLFVSREYGVAIAIVTQQDLQDAKLNSEAVDGISNFLNILTGVRAALVLFEREQGQITGSLRTNNDLIDLTSLAIILGGGGHQRAAGFTINGKLVEIDKGWQVI